MTIADVKWIKITTDMFDNRKIKHLRRLPDGDGIVLIWVMLLTMAGRCNSGGMIFLTENIPYTTKMLADELDFEESTVQLALNALDQLGMIKTDNDGFLSVTGWEKHQNTESLDKIREQTRKRVAKHRSKVKLLDCNDCGNVTVTDGNATDIEIDKEEETEEEIEGDINKKHVSSETVCCPKNVQRVIDAWNSLGLTKITKITDGTERSRMLKKRIKDYGLDSVLGAIENVRQSDFLMGKTNGAFCITFDWFIKPNNFPKVLDGNYKNKNKNEGGNSNGTNSGNFTGQYGVYL